VTSVWFEASTLFPEHENNLPRYRVGYGDVCSYPCRQVLGNPDHFDRRGHRFVRVLNSPQHGCLYGFVREDVELATNGCYLCCRHDVNEYD